MFEACKDLYHTKNDVRSSSGSGRDSGGILAFEQGRHVETNESHQRLWSFGEWYVANCHLSRSSAVTLLLSRLTKDNGIAAERLKALHG